MRLIASNDNEKQALLIQRELAEALHFSIEAVIREPLPERMVLLLLRAALAQTLRGRSEPPDQTPDR